MHTYHVKSPIDLWLLLLLLEWTENVFLLCWNYLAIFTSQNISLQIFWDHFLYQKKMRCQESKCTPYMMGLHSQLPFLGNFAFKLFIVLWSCLWRGNDRKLSKKGKLFWFFTFHFASMKRKFDRNGKVESKTNVDVSQFFEKVECVNSNKKRSTRIHVSRRNYGRKR
jgi:hypothetical protein